jgi:hypothetical protein
VCARQGKLFALWNPWEPSILFWRQILSYSC